MTFQLLCNPDKVGLDEIVFEQKKTKPKSFKKVVCQGWDTETYKDGRARILANSWEWMPVTSWGRALDFLTHRNHRGVKHFWWNLDFDVTALSKWNPSVWWCLTNEGMYEDEEVTIKYIPKKMLKITKGRNNYTHYDIAQFYNMPLGTATKKYLGEEQHEMKAFRDRVDEVPDYLLGSYCVWDCKKTRQLAERYIAGMHKVGLYPRHFISKGNLAEHAMRTHADVPTWHDNPKHVNKTAWEAYRGGWFDLWQKGTMQVWKYDIVSAYPHAMRQLPDFRFGQWVDYIDENQYVGFIRCRIKFDKNVPPFLSNWLRVSHFYCEFDIEVEATITLSEYKILKHQANIDVLYADTFVPSDNSGYPWRDVIDRFLILKKESKGDPAAYSVAKEVTNSQYGKTCQVVKERDSGNHKAGKVFNPVAAATITAETRCMIARAIEGYESDTVMIATDSITTTRPLNLNFGAEVGQWEIEAENDEGLFIKPGVYQVESDRKPHTRGFKAVVVEDAEGERVYKPLREYCQEADDDGVFKIEWHSPWTSRMANHRGKFSLANVWKPVERTIHPNDSRRLWERNVDSIKDLTETKVRSDPLPLSLALEVARIEYK